MPCFKRLPVLTAKLVLEFIQSMQSDVGKNGKGWLLRYSEQLKQTHSLPQYLIKHETLNKSTFGTDWKQLSTRIFLAEMGICNTFQLMQVVLSNKDSQHAGSEFEQLQNGILDTNNGVLSSMSVIHQLLVGRTVTNPNEKGLLEMWSTGIYENMRTNLMSGKTHQANVDKYLDNAAILQFKGILLFTEAKTNSRFCSLQLDFFEHNLKYQIDKKEKTVPIFMKYLTDPDGKKGFYLRPVFDGKDEPFVRSRGLRKRIGYDYMCGYTEDGKWFFDKSSSFDVDGSLLISGSSKDAKRYYMSVSEKNLVECVAEKNRATPFHVIPLDFSDNKLTASFCKSTSKPKDEHYLGTNLTCIGGNDDREFTISFDSGCLKVISE